MKKTAALMAVVTAAAGCATAPPNTPGAGIGATYTPVIDTTGVNPTKYYADLDSCRTFARQIDVNQQELNGIIAGAIAGALVGAAYGGNRTTIGNTATVGGAAWGGRAGTRALGKQETIVANCMASRGYRVLEGATIPAAANVPSPYVQAEPVIVPTPASVVSPSTTTLVPTSVKASPPAPVPRPFRPASCDWPGVTQGVGAC